MKKIYQLLLCACFSFQGLMQTTAQDFDRVLESSAKDANYLFDGYFNPVLKAAGAGLNQGWYNTAKAHKIAGFDITMSVAMVSIPGSDKSYSVDNNQLENISLISDGSNPVAANGVSQVPTLFGSSNAPIYDSVDPVTGARLGQQFNGPEGILDLADLPMKRFPFPVANIGIGLPKGTELKIRWTPEIDLGGEGSFKLFGFGLMHDIKQYIPGIKVLPFDLSAMFAYSKMDIGVDLNDNGTQRGEFSVRGTTIQAMISKKISVITPYAAIGWGLSNASIKGKGHYDFNDNAIVDAGETDPFSSEGKTSGPRITTGLRLKLLIFTFHADYTLQKYSTLTAGFGLSIR
jgi:hypothetical protein